MIEARLFNWQLRSVSPNLGPSGNLAYSGFNVSNKC